MLPSFCAEAEEDKHLDGQHAVEEAMSTLSGFYNGWLPSDDHSLRKAAALMRNCPKCKKAFIKEGGVRIVTLWGDCIMTNTTSI